MTICTRDRLPLLSKIENNGGTGLACVLYSAGPFTLTRIGEIVDRNWKEIPTHYPNVAIDDYIIMPNHLHGILIFNSRDKDVSNPDRALASNAPPLFLGSIIGAFKSRCVIENLKFIKKYGLDEIGKIW